MQCNSLGVRPHQGSTATRRPVHRAEDEVVIDFPDVRASRAVSRAFNAIAALVVAGVTAYNVAYLARLA